MSFQLQITPKTYLVVVANTPRGAWQVAKTKYNRDLKSMKAPLSCKPVEDSNA